MRKSEIVTYMRGFVDCYNTMIDLIEDETEPKALADVSENKRDLSETVKDAPKSRLVPEPKKVPEHAPPRKTNAPTHDRFVELFKEGKLPTEVAKELGVSPQTAYNHLTKAKDKGEL